MFRLALAALLALALPATAAAQYFELTPDRDSATVGDVVTFRVRLHLGLQQMLIEPVPRPAQDLPAGIRFLDADTLRATKDDANQGGPLYEGTLRLAFYRTGHIVVPPISVTFRYTAGDVTARITPQPVIIEIVPTIPAGNPSLKDLRPQAPVGGTSPVPFVLGALLAAIAALLWRRARRRRRVEAVVAPVVAAAAPTAYETAIARLRALEAARFGERDVAHHYAEVSDVLRTYLGETDDPVAPGTTAAELASTLIRAPGPELLHRRAARVFNDADFVKFASVRPNSRTADEYLEETRAVLDGWREREEPDAVR